VVIKEVEKGHFQASFIQRLDERGVPVKFFAYKTENYNPTGRGGYWGDFASEELNFCESQNHDYRCEELTVDNRTVTSFQEIPFGCDVEGAVLGSKS
jgi:hypothetical protein